MMKISAYLKLFVHCTNMIIQIGVTEVVKIELKYYVQNFIVKVFLSKRLFLLAFLDKITILRHVFIAKQQI
jgi:hypothetical protein